MKKLIWILAIPVMLASCNAQTGSNKDQTAQNEPQMDKKPENKPKVDIKVNKKYDDNGNLIGYDSTYTWTYSNLQGDTVSVNADSVITHFMPNVGMQFPGLKDPFFDDIFLNDTSMYNNFFDRNYYQDVWGKQNDEMTRMFRELDSLKTVFFKDNYPGLQPFDDKL